MCDQVGDKPLVSKYEAALWLFQKWNSGLGFKRTKDQTRIQAYELPRQVHRDDGGFKFSRSLAWRSRD